MRKAVLAALIAVTANAQAQVYFTGNDLFGAAESTKSGYVVGVVDASEDLDKKTFCTPKHVTVGQLKDVVTKFLSDHPEHRHFSASSLVIGSLKQAFPCK